MHKMSLHVLALAAAATAAAGYYMVRRRRRTPPAALVAALQAYEASGDEDVSWLGRLEEAAGCELTSAEFAAVMDAATVTHRGDFHIPPDEATGGEQAYFAGNSLGLQPKGTAAVVKAELAKWAGRGVMGHFEGLLPWATCEDVLAAPLAEIIGVPPELAALEVGAMNSLTVNLHLLMCAFYRPTEGRAAILIEAGAFPSDRYAVGSQIRHHGRDPAQWLIEVHPRASDGLLHTEDILTAIEANAGRLALVLLGGVNYLTGQVLDMAALSAHMHARNLAARAAGRPTIPFGLDLAHAVGNVPLSLHEWQVDFAAWCSYKYLNSGAGCLAGLFVHERHASDGDLYPRLTGWWGVPLAKRFAMAQQYDEAAGARGFGVSNVNPLLVASVYGSLQAFGKAGGVRSLRRKSVLLTGYLEALLHARGLLMTALETALETDEGKANLNGRSGGATLRLVTPADPKQRGCQLSLRVIPAPSGRSARKLPLTMRALEEALRERGVVGDAREPDIVRLAPTPLYNTFTDVWRAVAALEDALH